MTDDGDRRLSEDAQGMDVHPRGVGSDPGASDVPRKPKSCLFRILWSTLAIALGVGLLVVLIARLDRATDPSEPLNASGTESTVTDQGGTSSEPTSGTAESISGTEESISGTAGPISGTWAMYWTNSKGSESQAFTIRFTGGGTGTLEILEDYTEFNTAFKVEGDQVMFEFTRTFQVPIGDWPEKSYFVGVLTGRNEMSGEWAREGWECWPDHVELEIIAGCASELEWSRHPSHLIRMSE